MSFPLLLAIASLLSINPTGALDRPLFPSAGKQFFQFTQLRIIPSYTAHLAGTEIPAIQSLGTLCDKELPSLKQYDQWGQRVDELSTSQGWRAMKAIAFREGLISIAYDREKYEEWARIYMFAKVHMFDADGRMVRVNPVPKQNHSVWG
jgi:hypothetical protein